VKNGVIPDVSDIPHGTEVYINDEPKGFVVSAPSTAGTIIAYVTASLQNAPSIETVSMEPNGALLILGAWSKTFGEITVRWAEGLQKRMLAVPAGAALEAQSLPLGAAIYDGNVLLGKVAKAGDGKQRVQAVGAPNINPAGPTAKITPHDKDGLTAFALGFTSKTVYGASGKVVSIHWGHQAAGGAGSLEVPEGHTWDITQMPLNSEVKVNGVLVAKVVKIHDAAIKTWRVSLVNTKGEELPNPKTKEKKSYTSIFAKAEAGQNIWIEWAKPDGNVEAVVLELNKLYYAHQFPIGARLRRNGVTVAVAKVTAKHDTQYFQDVNEPDEDGKTMYEKSVEAHEKSVEADKSQPKAISINQNSITVHYYADQQGKIWQGAAKPANPFGEYVDWAASQKGLSILTDKPIGGTPPKVVGAALLVQVGKKTVILTSQDVSGFEIAELPPKNTPLGAIQSRFELHLTVNNHELRDAKDGDNLIVEAMTGTEYTWPPQPEPKRKPSFNPWKHLELPEDEPQPEGSETDTNASDET
jgi:hypothetical protein